ncbi:MAG: DUF2807 domain-containing protein [Chitinophagaceae bacterium]|nr:DUF2807 domain-containing protein [Chitinophagaceae bacterium]
MKKLFLFLTIFASTLFTKTQNDIVVNPNAEVRPFTGSFHAIRVSGSIDLFLSQSEQVSMAISASEDRFKEGIKTVAENGVLRIYYEGEKSWSSKNRKLKVYISFRELDKIEASGASDVRVIGKISVPVLSLVLSGASDFRGAVKTDSLLMNLSGASDVSIEGTSNTVRIESSGASDVKGYGLVTDYCTASASGASDITITVNKELNAHASGASDIYFKGTGLIREIHNSGASNVARKG